MVPILSLRKKSHELPALPVPFNSTVFSILARTLPTPVRSQIYVANFEYVIIMKMVVTSYSVRVTDSWAEKKKNVFSPFIRLANAVILSVVVTYFSFRILPSSWGLIL